MWLFSSYKDTSNIELGFIVVKFDIILIYILMTSAEALLPNKVTDPGPRDYDCNISFWETRFNPKITY